MVGVIELIEPNFTKDYLTSAFLLSRKVPSIVVNPLYFFFLLTDEIKAVPCFVCSLNTPCPSKSLWIRTSVVPFLFLSPVDLTHNTHVISKSSSMAPMEERADTACYLLCNRGWYGIQYTAISLLALTCPGTTLGPVLAPINGELVREFHTSYTTVANFAGYQFLASGAGGLVCQLTARLWGKRPIYLMSVVFLLVGTVWNAVVRSGDVRGFMGARVIQVALD